MNSFPGSSPTDPSSLRTTPNTNARVPHPKRCLIALRVGTSTLALALLLCLYPSTSLHAQRESSALTESEVEQLRESAYVATDRVLVFIKFLDERTRTIQTLAGTPRKPGREQDLHDLLEQFTSIADELNDNLDDYGPAHRDMRKALPRLLSATERWATAIKSPADNDAYNVSRKLALEAVRDVREESTRLIEEQRIWFTAHPPAKETKGDAPYIPG